MKIRPAVAEVFHADRHDEANSRLFAILQTLLKSTYHHKWLPLFKRTANEQNNYASTSSKKCVLLAEYSTRALFGFFLVLRWSRGSVLAFSTQVRGFKPGRSRRIFRAKKSSARLPSEGK